jgi:hypothetical protein
MMVSKSLIRGLGDYNGKWFTRKVAAAGKRSNIRQIANMLHKQARASAFSSASPLFNCASSYLSNSNLASQNHRVKLMQAKKRAWLSPGLPLP